MGLQGIKMKINLIPFAARGPSGDSLDNLLTKENNIYVMDNHRLALWCWFQSIKKAKRYNLFHIDAHPDMSQSGLADSHQDLWNLSLEEYRTALQVDINTPLFRWDNYLEIFLQKYSDNVGHTISATHHLGSNKGLQEEVKPLELIKRLDDIFSEKIYVNNLTWIVNLDLDYFFSSRPQKLQLFSDEFIDALTMSIRQGLDNGAIEVLTVALSPECCGGWDKAFGMLTKVMKNINSHAFHF